MELYRAILSHARKACKEEMMKSDIERLFEKECYAVLERIKTVLADDSSDDKECFEKIERIVCLFEEIGSDGGSRHDFG